MPRRLRHDDSSQFEKAQKMSDKQTIMRKIFIFMILALSRENSTNDDQRVKIGFVSCNSQRRLDVFQSVLKYRNASEQMTSFQAESIHSISLYCFLFCLVKTD